MNIDFNDALHDMADDEGREGLDQSAQPEQAAGASAAPQRGEAPAEGGSRTKAIIAGTAGLAVLALAGYALWPNQPETITGAASPAASSSAADPQLAQSTPSTSATALSSTNGWQWNRTDPATTTVDEAQVRSWCKVTDAEQVLPRKGNTFRPGQPVVIGPKSATAPAAGAPVSKPWRMCTLGYDQLPSAALIGDTELSKDPAKLKQACSTHSGFTFGPDWKVAVQDTRLNPRTNNVSDATLAMTTADGWAVGCEMSAGSDVATLTFLAPDSKDSCIRVHAASMAKPGGGPGGPAPKGAPAGPPPGEGPGGELYWVTAFGRVPDVDGLRTKAASAGFNIGKEVESNAMVHVANGIAVANHTWKPDAKAAADKNGTPTVHFFDKAGTELHSCTAN